MPFTLWTPIFMSNHVRESLRGVKDALKLLVKPGATDTNLVDALTFSVFRCWRARKILCFQTFYAMENARPPKGGLRLVRQPPKGG